MTRRPRHHRKDGGSAENQRALRPVSGSLSAVRDAPPYCAARRSFTRLAERREGRALLVRAAFSRRHTGKMPVPHSSASALRPVSGSLSVVRDAPPYLCCAPVIHPSRGASGGTSVARPGGVFTPPHGQDARATHGRCDLRPALPPKICVHLWIKNPSTAKQTNALMH
jgi:hypothetical protein